MRPRRVGRDGARTSVAPSVEDCAVGGAGAGSVAGEREGNGELLRSVHLLNGEAKGAAGPTGAP